MSMDGRVNGECIASLGRHVESPNSDRLPDSQEPALAIEDKRVEKEWGWQLAMVTIYKMAQELALVTEGERGEDKRGEDERGQGPALVTEERGQLPALATEDERG